MANNNRLPVIEPGEVDFPFYNDKPVGLIGGQWWLVMVGVALGFASLNLAILSPGSQVLAFLGAFLFGAIPLAFLARFAGHHWRAIFRPVRGRDVLLMVGIAVLNLIATFVIANLALSLFGAAQNETVAGVVDFDTVGRVLFFLRTGFQLFGEEVITILPFLAIMAWAHYSGRGRRTAVVLAWFGSMVVFAAIHLPTYEWNLLQCLVVIGKARLILSLAFIITKNIWVSTGAHILNDWAIFAVVILQA